FRIRTVRLDCGKLDRLIDEFSRRALAEDGQVSASFAAVAIKALERKHDLTGANAAQRIALQILAEPAETVDGTKWVKSAIMDLARGDESGSDKSSEPPESTH